MAKFAPYATVQDKVWYYAFRIICALILLYLIFPVLVIIPLSFNDTGLFTYSKEFLSFQEGEWSFRHYNDFLYNEQLGWLDAVRNSIIVAFFSTFICTALGTVAALGLSNPRMPYRSAIMALMLSPMIVPLIISALAMYFFYSRLGLQGTYLGVILTHVVLGTPFVVITVTATLSGFDRNLIRAGLNLGASPTRVFFKVIMPLILPGVISGALFAFVTSFDEVVVVTFIAAAQQHTIPIKMFSGLREQISPVILAVATLLILLSISLLTTVELLRRRSEVNRGTGTLSTTTGLFSRIWLIGMVVFLLNFLVWLILPLMGYQSVTWGESVLTLDDLMVWGVAVAAAILVASVAVLAVGSLLAMMGGKTKPKYG